MFSFNYENYSPHEIHPFLFIHVRFHAYFEASFYTTNWSDSGTSPERSETFFSENHSFSYFARKKKIITAAKDRANGHSLPNPHVKIERDFETETSSYANIETGSSIRLFQTESNNNVHCFVSSDRFRD